MRAGLPIWIAVPLCLAACATSGGAGQGGAVGAGPASAPSCRDRACVLWHQGRLRQARQELMLGLALDPRSAELHRLLGLLELRSGRRGAALRHLRRALALDPARPGVEAHVAALLLERARLRLDPDVGLLQPGPARADLRRVLELDPARRAEACRMDREAVRLQRLLDRPGGRRALVPRAGRGGEVCPGPPPDLDIQHGHATPQRCGLASPGRFQEEMRRRYLLLGCRGAQLAIRLEAHGCVSQAAQVWDLLRREDPGDPRWQLQLARNLLLRGSLERARMFLASHVFLSADRAGALMAGSRLLLHAGHPQAAARLALESLAFADSVEDGLAAVEQIRRCGLDREAREAARQLLHRPGRWGVPPERLHGLVERAVAGGTPGP